LNQLLDKSSWANDKEKLINRIKREDEKKKSDFKKEETFML